MKQQRQHRRHLSVFFLLMLSLSHIPTCDAFASMFVENKSSCWIELRDTKTEVIMNNLIIPVQESSHGENDVRIKVLDELTMEVPTGLVVKGAGKTVVYIPKSEESDSNEGSSSKASFRLILEVDENAKLYDLQYVMDAKVFPELDEEEMDILDTAFEATINRIKAHFPSRKSGCDKSRSFGKKGDAGVVLDVQIPHSLYSPQLEEQYVDVVAGWACGHEAVTLTHSIEFRPLVDGGDGKGNAREEVAEEVVSEKIAEDMPGVLDVPVEVGEEVEVIRDEQEEEQRQRNIRGRSSHQKEVVNGNLHKFNQMYQKSSFGQAAFTNFGYLKGIAIIVSFAAVLWKVYLSKRKKSKGRREL